ncbi:unnamed protein product, partial [Choristocarpus tenellus]
NYSHRTELFHLRGRDQVSKVLAQHLRSANYRSLLEEGLVPDRGVKLGPARNFHS